MSLMSTVLMDFNRCQRCFRRIDDKELTQALQPPRHARRDCFGKIARRPVVNVGDFGVQFQVSIDWMILKLRREVRYFTR